jgi:hypothetical protein
MPYLFQFILLQRYEYNEKDGNWLEFYLYALQKTSMTVTCKDFRLSCISGGSTEAGI